MLSVLLAEDDRLLSHVFECYLNSLGISVLRAASVEEARRVLLTTQIDCVISDYFLEGGTVRDIAKVARVPMLVISGFDRSYDPELPIHAWLTKPFDLGSVERLVRQLCAQPA